MVVTGLGDERVRDWWASARRPLRAQFVHNPRYADLNNFHTLEIACLEAAPGRLLVLNSDIVFADRVVGDAEAAGGDLTLAVEAGRVDDEALKVRLSDGHVRELGKHIAQAEAHGEFIGVSLLSDLGRERYAQAAGEARDAGETTLYYEDVYSRICQGVDSRVSSVAAATWAEIDAPEDVPAARQVVQGAPG
jgi:choline kinase